jgi:hypothetical protein
LDSRILIPKKRKTLTEKLDQPDFPKIRNIVPIKSLGHEFRILKFILKIGRK